MGRSQSINGNGEHDPHVILQRVRNASQLDAERLLTGEFGELREEIIRLFREGKRSIDIAEQLEDQLPIPAYVPLTTKSGVIRRMIAQVLSVEERKELSSMKHARRLKRTIDVVSAGRDAWMEEQGMLVWTEEWNTYLQELIAEPDYQRSETRLNHTKICDEMNAHFQTDIFTIEGTRRHVEYLRLMQRKVAKNGNGNGEH